MLTVIKTQTTFGCQVGDDFIHGSVFGAADDFPALSLLADQPGGDQSGDVMGQGRARYAQGTLQGSYIGATITGADQEAENFESRLVAKGFQSTGDLVIFHPLMVG